MIKPQIFYEQLRGQGIDFFAGVPDSLLKDFCAYVTSNTDSKNHVITANEGNAIGIATGHYLATGKPGLVYMQNSGLGNCVNPLASLADQKAYSIPMLLVIGWRGEPGKKDEPQHVKQGMITLGLLNTIGIDYQILPDTEEDSAKAVAVAVNHAKKKNEPFALVIRKGTFDKYSLDSEVSQYQLTREDAAVRVASMLHDKDIVISTTGKTSRELFEYRARKALGHQRDFLTVGSMGHSSSIALGIALEKPDRSVYCFDGDGAVIMHMGAFATIGQHQPKNLKHIIFNNFAHDSVGGQPTAAGNIDFCTVAKANGYKHVFSAKTVEEVEAGLRYIQEQDGPNLLEIKVKRGARVNLGRPTRTPLENKFDFMSHLQND
jgi:phosphonopyruvate decarboxylase